MMRAGAAQTREGLGRSAEALPARRSRRLTATLRSLVADRLAFSAALFLVVLVLVAVLAPVVAPFNPDGQSLMLRNQPPLTAAEGDASVPHLLGTDFIGRDVLSRLIHGARVSLSVAAAGVLFAGVVGTAVGAIAGYRRGAFDSIAMRAVDLQMSFPALLLALVVLYALGSGVWNLILVLAVTRWTIYARVARASVLTEREQPFVEAARASGASGAWIMTRHLLPNVLPTLIVLATLEAASLMLAEATLSFLGLGLPIETPSWGQSLAGGRPYITTAWWLVTFPGLAIFFAVLSLNLVGAWARKVVDPLA